ncbi:conserved Plasmodium protein, unknown function [Plasmodium relictum]|uniref:Uncharacterized protein n=1 Tax=Plasmodium relictum TaxID=85471 RepID=A0A1J1H8L0_PLARL|nr:conserved Plasmodium protein, unknown function [Plasmodium relictum]CRH00886.1 conserved Plasmodium protein, unknown function [Plasmodium relictum]
MEDTNTNFFFDMLDMIDSYDNAKLKDELKGKNNTNEKVTETNISKNKTEVLNNNVCISGDIKKSRKQNEIKSFPEVNETKHEVIYESKKNNNNFLRKTKFNDNENKLKKRGKIKKRVEKVLNRKISKNCNLNVLSNEESLNNETLNQKAPNENISDIFLYDNKISNEEMLNNKNDLDTKCNFENCRDYNNNNNASLNEIYKVDKDIFSNSLECKSCKNYLKELTSKNYMSFSIYGEYINDGENNLLLLKNKKIEELENKNKLILHKMEILRRKNSFLNDKIKNFSTSLNDLNLNFKKLVKENNVLKEINKNLSEELEKEKSSNLKKKKNINKESPYCKKSLEREFEDSIDKEIFNEYY